MRLLEAQGGGKLGPGKDPKGGKTPGGSGEPGFLIERDEGDPVSFTIPKNPGQLLDPKTMGGLTQLGSFLAATLGSSRAVEADEQRVLGAMRTELDSLARACATAGLTDWNQSVINPILADLNVILNPGVAPSPSPEGGKGPQAVRGSWRSLRPAWMKKLTDKPEDPGKK